MSRIILLILIAFSSNLIKPQEIPLQYILEPLDLQQVPTGFLYDYTFNWGNSYWYNGNYQDTLPNDKYVWYQIHLDLERNVVKY